MDITPDTLKLIFQVARTFYDQGVGRVKTPLMDNLVETVPAITKEVIFAFMDRIPKFREWVGPRKNNNVVIENYKLSVKKYENGIEILRDHIEDDQLGVYSTRFARLGEQTRKWPELLVRDKLQAGKTEVCFDGKNFFATDHYKNVGKKTGSQANLFTAKPLTQANFIDVYQKMMGLVGSDGEPLDDFGDDLYLVHEASNADTAKRICSMPLLVNDGTVTTGVSTAFGAVSSTTAGVAKPLLVNSLGSEPGVWYLADCGGQRPLIFGARYMPDLVPRFSLDDPHVYDLDSFLLGSRARGVAGLGVWWKMARCEP